MLYVLGCRTESARIARIVLAKRLDLTGKQALLAADLWDQALPKEVDKMWFDVCSANISSGCC